MMLSSGKFSINHIAQMMGHTNVDMLIHKYNKFIPAEVRKIVYYPKKIKQHFLNRYSKRAKIIIENERVIS